MTNLHRYRRVLFIAYQFPPVGGVGVHRVTKYVKYLPNFDWNSSVLTVSNPSVPLLDESLLNDIPAGTIIRRARTYEPGYALKKKVSGGQNQRDVFVSRMKTAVRTLGNMLLQPDAQVLWHPNAYRQGLRLLRDLHHDAIIATGPPFSSFLLGAKLAKKTGLPLILDYRDEWDISNAYWENKSQSCFSNWWQTRQQHAVLRKADVVCATTPSSANAIHKVAQLAGSQACSEFIYNGFDPEDYPSNIAVSKQDFGNGTHRFRLSFIGTLWNLNSIEPIVHALETLNRNSPALAAEIELLLAGRRTEEQDAILNRLETTNVALTRLPFVSHSDAVSLMRSSDSLLMINSNLPQTQRIINAKTFEYMAARRPMFVVAPKGDVWDIVQNLPGSVLCEPSQVDQIADRLELLIEQHRCGIQHSECTWDIEQFHRSRLTNQLAELLNRTVEARQVREMEQHDILDLRGLSPKKEGQSR